MAYSFDGVNQYLNTSSAPATVAPLTLFARVVPNSGKTGSQVVVSVGASGSGTNRWQVVHSGINRDATFGAYAATSGLATTNGVDVVTVEVWNSLTGVESSSSNRELYAEANSVATNTSDITPAGANALYIAARNNNSIGVYHNGELAEIAVWNVNLTAAEIASLAKGFKPSRIRPQNLKFYAPLVRVLQDTVGGLAITNNNTATVAAHPRVY